MTIHFVSEVTLIVRRLALASFPANHFFSPLLFIIFSKKVSLELVQVDRLFELIPFKISQDGGTFGE